MESTFSAQYQATRQADGSLLIGYRNKGYHAPGFMGHVAILFLPALFYLALTAAALYAAPIIGLVMLGPFIWFIFVLFNGIGRSITVIPKQGITWSSKRLPFSDIDEFGVMKVRTSYGESGYIYAKSNGLEIAITRHIPIALAESIHDRIQKEITSP